MFKPVAILSCTLFNIFDLPKLCIWPPASWNFCLADPVCDSIIGVIHLTCCNASPYKDVLAAWDLKATWNVLPKPAVINGLAISGVAENITLPIYAKLAQSLRSCAFLAPKDAGSCEDNVPYILSFWSSNAFNTSLIFVLSFSDFNCLLISFLSIWYKCISICLSPNVLAISTALPILWV